MDFSDTTNKDGIIQTCELLLDLGDAGISGNSTLLKQFTNLINNDAYDEVIAEILKNEGTWNWDDYAEGNSRLPTATQTMTADVGNYALPNGASNSGLGSSDASSFLRLIKVQVKDSAGYFQTVNPIDESSAEQPLETVFATSGFPKFYDQIGTSIILYPSPASASVTLTNGLKITFQRDKVEFTTADTTKNPGFPAIYHMLLPLIASETWAYIKNMKQAPFLTQKKLKFMANLGWGIANRNKDLRQAITPKRNNYF